jgi:hypothetical protein
LQWKDNLGLLAISNRVPQDTISAGNNIIGIVSACRIAMQIK